MTRGLLALLIGAALLVLAPTAQAHGLASGLLRIDARANGEATLLLKIPAVKGRFTVLDVRLPGGCRSTSTPVVERTARAETRRWEVRCPVALVGQAIEVRGLDDLVGDVAVDVRQGDQSFVALATVASPRVRVEAPTSEASVPPAGYLRLGIEHILGGADHLLFVLGLLLVVWTRQESRRWRTLLTTITAFTIAHSITLGMVSLGVIHLARAPVELAIAASVVLLGVELARSRGEPSETLTFRFPWAVAFGFGLLHGLGFGGALADLGFPEAGLALALLYFNVGVELGQLAFVAALLAVAALPKPTWFAQRARPVVVYALGTGGAFFVWERLVALGGGS